MVRAFLSWLRRLFGRRAKVVSDLPPGRLRWWHVHRLLTPPPAPGVTRAERRAEARRRFRLLRQRVQLVRQGLV